MRKLALLVLLTLSLIGCQKEPLSPTPDNNGDKISFSTDVSTRGDVITSDNIKDMILFCYNTGKDSFAATATPNWMYKAKGSRANTGTDQNWTIEASSTIGDAFEGKWEKGSNHTFFAFAPYTILADGETFSGKDKAGAPTLTFDVSVQENSTQPVKDQKDLLYATQHNLKSNNTNNKPVPLQFNHALSKVRISAKLKDVTWGGSRAKVRIHGIALENIWVKGVLGFEPDNQTIKWNLDGQSNNNTLVYSDAEAGVGSGNFNNHLKKYVFVGDSKYLSPIAGTTEMEQDVDIIDIIVPQNPLFMMPQPLAENSGSVVGTPAMSTPKLTIAYHDYKDDGGETLTDVIKEYSFDLPLSWEANKGYYYELIFNPAAGESPWAMKTTITKWNDQPIDADVDGGFFKLTDGKTYNASDANDPIATPKVIEIPFETDYLMSELTTPNTKTIIDYANKKIIYTSAGDQITDVIALNVKGRKIDLMIDLRDVLDYTNSATVNTLTGLEDGDGGVTGLRVANSYIINPAQSVATYIPVVDRTNDFWKNYATTGNTNEMIASADWTNDPNFTLEKLWYNGAKAPVFDIEKVVSPAGLNAIKVTFPANFEPQNIAVAVKKNSVVVWSWHLWVTDYWPYNTVPSTTVDTKQDVVGGEVHRYNNGSAGAGDLDAWTTIYNGKFIMDRNLGAYAPTYDGHGGGGTRGGALYYQYGRKDPFPSNYAKKFGSNAFWIVETYTERGNIDFAYSVNNPTTFFTQFKGNWTNESAAMSADILWNDKKTHATQTPNSKQKSIFDPSPLGWRVPVNGVWSNFTTTTTTWFPNAKGRAYELNSGSTAYLPFADTRGTDGHLSTYSGLSGFYYNSTLPLDNKDNQVELFYITNYFSQPTTYYRTAAHSVRPIQE